MPSKLVPCVSGNDVYRSWSSVSAFCVSLSSLSKHWSPTASSVRQDWEWLSTNLSRFFSPLKNPHTQGSEWIHQPTSCTLPVPEWSYSGPAQG